MIALFLAAGGGGIVAFASPQKKEVEKFYTAHRFLPRDHPGVEYAGTGLGSRICTGTTNEPGEESFMGTSAELPDGVKVTKITYYFIDPNPDADFSFHFGGSFIGPEGHPHEGIVTQNDEIVAPASSSGVDPDPTSIELIPDSPYEVDTGEDLGLLVGFGECSPGPHDETHLVLHGATVEYSLK